MIERRELESNVMYGRARDLGMPIEHVMSTLFYAGDHWTSGVSFYRAERRPFSERDCTVLAELIPALRNTVRNRRLFGESERRAGTLEELLSKRGLPVVVFSQVGTEVARSKHVTRLVEKWFAPEERGAGGLPDALLLRVRHGGCTCGHAEVWRSSGTRDLLARVYALPYGGRNYLALLLEEVANTPCAPATWRERLTPREFEVADRVVRGWDNRLVADDLRCAEWTVRTHLRNLFPKLGVESRAQLTILAIREFQASTISGSQG